MSSLVYVGVDIGGSHIGIGIIDRDSEVIARDSVEFDRNVSPNDAVDLIFSHTNTLILSLAEVKIASIGIGCPGASKDGILIAASNLPKFKDVPLVNLVSDKFGGLPTVLLNDAACALSAELRSPAGQRAYHGVKFAAIITLGTGIGASLFLNNEFYQGSHNVIECGHMIVATHPGARECPCGQVGCVETFASASSTARRMQEVDDLFSVHLQGYNEAEGGVENDASSHFRPSGGPGDLSVDGIQVDQDHKEVISTSPSKAVSGGAREVFQRAADGDVLADQVLDETAKHIAVLCINLCRVLDLEVIILAGGMAAAGKELLHRVQRMVETSTWTVLPTPVRITLAQCANDAGMLGAALAGKDALEKLQNGNVPLQARLSESSPYARSRTNSDNQSLSPRRGRTHSADVQYETGSYRLGLPNAVIVEDPGERIPDDSSASDILSGRQENEDIWTAPAEHGPNAEEQDPNGSAPTADIDTANGALLEDDIDNSVTSSYIDVVTLSSMHNAMIVAITAGISLSVLSASAAVLAVAFGTDNSNRNSSRAAVTATGTGIVSIVRSGWTLLQGAVESIVGRAGGTRQILTTVFISQGLLLCGQLGLGWLIFSEIRRWKRKSD